MIVLAPDATVQVIVTEDVARRRGLEVPTDVDTSASEVIHF